MIDLLWTGVGGIVGAGLGALAGVVADRVRKRRSRLRWYVGLGGMLLFGWLGATLSTPPPLETQLDAAGPVFKAIHKHYPGVFAQMAFAARGVNPRDQVALQSTVRPLLSALIQSHKSEIDDEVAAAIAQLMLDETDAMRDAPDACVAALSGRAVSIDLRTVSSPQLRRRDSEVTAQLIEQVATRPAAAPAPLSGEEDQRILEHALDKLTSGDREVVTPLLQQRRQPSNDREAAAYCAFQRARLAAAMDAPTGTLRRFLAG